MQCFLHLIVTLWAKQGTLHSWWKKAMLWGHSVFSAPFLVLCSQKFLETQPAVISCPNLAPRPALYQY